MAENRLHDPTSASWRRLFCLLAAVTLALSLTTLISAPAAHAAPPAGISMKQAIASHPTIRVGQRDKAVKYLKRQFGMKGKYPRYTKTTARKVARFEARHGLPADGGRVTGETWRALGVSYSRSAAVARDRAERQAHQASRTSSRSAAVLREAARHAGKPYAYGGNGPHAFDCSGFTRYVYARVGVSLPRTAAQQRGATARISRAQLRPGDLVFVHRGGYVSHVAIYAGNNMWWEATRPGQPLAKNRAWTTSVSFGRA